MKTPLVTAIVSTYNAERFMRGCLEDLLAQTIADQVEVLVIDSGSQQRESAICEEFARRHDTIRLVRTEREPLYAAWNRAIGLARGTYLTNANTDDRHRRDAFERLATALDRAPQAALAYGDQFVSPVENETFDACAAQSRKVRRAPDYAPDELMLRCITGSQPMWRKASHDRHGVFDTRYAIAGDYDLWMRFAQTSEFRHVAEPLGVFYDSPHTLSGASNRWRTDMESLDIKLRHVSRDPWRSSPALRSRLAECIFGMGYHYVEQARDMAKARPFLAAAWRLQPLNFRYAKSLVLRGVLRSTARLGAPQRPTPNEA